MSEPIKDAYGRIECEYCHSMFDPLLGREFMHICSGMVISLENKLREQKELGELRLRQIQDLKIRISELELGKLAACKEHERDIKNSHGRIYFSKMNDPENFISAFDELATNKEYLTVELEKQLASERALADELATQLKSKLREHAHDESNIHYCMACTTLSKWKQARGRDK